MYEIQENLNISLCWRNDNKCSLEFFHPSTAWRFCTLQLSRADFSFLACVGIDHKKKHSIPLLWHI